MRPTRRIAVFVPKLMEQAMPPATQDPRAQLAFNPGWVFDPAPWWVLQYLDRQIVLELARVHFDARKAILAVESKAIDEAQSILKRAGAGAKS